MAAKEMSVFLPKKFQKTEVFNKLVGLLALTVDSIPDGSPYEFSAQRGNDGSYLLIEYDANPQDVIQELSEWKRPTGEYKKILTGCEACFVIHYRATSDARSFLLLLAETVQQIAPKSIVDNGLGCLLLLSEIVARMNDDSDWSWEKETFPELAGVARSEWLD